MTELPRFLDRTLLFRVTSRAEFLELNRRTSHLWKRISEEEDRLAHAVEAAGEATLRGYSVTAGREVDFRVARRASGEPGINWRESLVCPVTQLNNRMRAAAFLLEVELGLAPDAPLYLTEQVTPFYRFVRERYANAVGSEFVDRGYAPGRVEDGVRHEDLCALSFPDASFDALVTLDCLEHIPSYSEALRECARVLRPGGRALVSVPFGGGPSTQVRATVGPDGAITHCEPPLYHGDPMGGGEGILCYYHFGWDLLAVLRHCGFERAWALVFWSDVLGNLDGRGLYFVAEKAR